MVTGLALFWVTCKLIKYQQRYLKPATMSNFKGMTQQFSEFQIHSAAHKTRKKRIVSPVPLFNSVESGASRIKEYTWWNKYDFNLLHQCLSGTVVTPSASSPLHHILSSPPPVYCLHNGAYTVILSLTVIFHFALILAFGRCVYPLLHSCLVVVVVFL